MLQVVFHLSGCRSLKEKRQRLKGIRDRFGRSSNVAVCESAYQDSLQRAEWSFVASASSRAVVEKSLADIERSLSLSVDAEIVDVRLRWLV
jgi:uncharacterized protein YlxP (DUF503 family)